MKTRQTKVTSKYQTTIPEEVRKYLDVKAGEEVEWNIVKSIIIVNKHKKIKNPTKFLTSQIKLDIDAVKLVREVREEFG